MCIYTDKPEVQIVVLPSADVKEHNDVTVSCSAIANPESVSWRYVYLWSYLRKCEQNWKTSFLLFYYFSR